MNLGVLLGFFLFLSLIANGFLAWGIKRAMERTEEYEEYLTATQNRIRLTIEAMRNVDLRGSFESDDEVGAVFQEMKALVEALDVFLMSEGDDAEES